MKNIEEKFERFYFETKEFKNRLLGIDEHKKFWRAEIEALIKEILSATIMKIPIKEDTPLDYQDGFSYGWNDARDYFIQNARKRGIKI